MIGEGLEGRKGAGRVEGGTERVGGGNVRVGEYNGADNITSTSFVVYFALSLFSWPMYLPSIPWSCCKSDSIA